jgi:hydroxypyruvate isomerase
VEFPSPYEFDASLLADHLAQYAFPLIEFAAPAGVTKGIAALQGKEEEFRAGLGPGRPLCKGAGLFAALEQRGYPGWIGCEYQ